MLSGGRLRLPELTETLRSLSSRISSQMRLSSHGQEHAHGVASSPVEPSQFLRSLQSAPAFEFRVLGYEQQDLRRLIRPTELGQALRNRYAIVGMELDLLG